MDDAQWNSLDTSPGIPPTGGYPTAPPDAGGGGFGGAGGGDTTPQPPAPNAQPPWGQSLGSDVGKVGSAISGAIPEGGLEPNSGAIGSDTGDAMSQKMQGLKDYISGKGAMPKDQFEEMNKAVDPRGTMDQNERSVRMLDATANNPQQAASVVQALRQHWDIQRGNAAKLLTEGNATMAASEMSKGFQYVPDGTKTMVTPNKDGFTFTTHTMDGQDTTNYMDANQTKQFLTGAHGLFDHVVGQGAGTVLSSLSPPPPSGGGASAEAGGPPPDSFANTQVGDVPQAPKKGYPPENPATQAQPDSYDPRADDPNADFGQGNAVVSAGGSKKGSTRGLPSPNSGLPNEYGRYDAGPAQPRATPGQADAYSKWHNAQTARNDVLKDGGMTPQQNRANWNAKNGLPQVKGDPPPGPAGGQPFRRTPTFTNPDNKTDDEINSPITVDRGVGKKGRSLEGNAQAPSGTSDDLRSLARQMHPDDATGQAEFYEQQRSIAQEQASKLDVAKNTRVMGSQAVAAGRNIDSANRAGSVVQAAQIKADQMAAGTTDKTAAENLRTASTILGNQMKGASGGDAGAAIKALRAGGVSENLIGQLVNPAPGPARAQGQGRRLGGQQAAPQDDQSGQNEFPQEAMQHLQEGVPTQFKNGQTWMLRSGKPVRVK